MSYENIWEKDGVYRKYSNCITGKEILQAVQDVHGSAQFDSICYVINDLLDVTEHDISHKEIKTIVAINRAAALTNPNIKVAVVATIPTIQDMVSLYCELMNNTPFSCEEFTKLEDARKWATT